jgi:hypothetical protein
MHGVKTIFIILLLLIGFHLMLYGYLRRRIAAAKARAMAEERGEDAKRNTRGDNGH